MERSELSEKPSPLPQPEDQAPAPTSFLSDQNRPESEAPLDGPAQPSRQSEEQTKPAQLQETLPAHGQEEVQQADPQGEPEAVQREPEATQQVGVTL